MMNDWREERSNPAMEQQQPVQCILPSNAPILQTDGGYSRILQESCGNRRIDSYGQEHELSRQSPVHILPDENYLIDDVYHNNSQTSLLREQEIKRQTDRLCQRFLNCKPYAKYRANVAKAAKKADVKWPIELEMAFFRGQILIIFYRLIANKNHFCRLGRLPSCRTHTTTL